MLLGHIHVHLATSVPAGYEYPHPDAYLTLFWGRVRSLGPFVGNAESTEARLFSSLEARKLENIQRGAEFFEAALRFASLS